MSNVCCSSSTIPQELMQDCPANSTNATWSNLTEELDPINLLSSILPDLEDLQEDMLEMANIR